MSADQTSPERDAWVLRVLQVDVRAAAGRTGENRRAPPPPSPPPKPARLLPLWRETRAALDSQITALQRALRSYDHPDLHAIAEYGFNALTDGSNTALMAAMFDYDAEPAPSKARAIRAALGGYSTLLEPGSVLDDYDANPLGVSVRLRATLQRGLDTLRAALDRADAAGPELRP